MITTKPNNYVGLSYQSRVSIREMLTDWGFTDNSVSYFHDSHEFIIENLKLQGLDSIEISDRLKMY